jgi:hypothetical protein
MSESKYPLIYKLDDNMVLHIEHINDAISTIWFDKEDERQLVPREFELYNGKNLIEPYQNTQTYIIARDRYYEIYYKKKNIISIELWFLPIICHPTVNEKTLNINRLELHEN